MKKIFKENILDEALIWLDSKLTVILATVISTWGSSPRPVSSQMIINNKNKFSGSISGGCVEANVINEASKMIKEKKLCKKLEFLVSNDKAWKIGLACGGKITVLLEKVNLEKQKVLEKIVKKERKKNSFSVITNIKSGYSCIFEKSNELEGDFKKYYKKINLYFHKNKNGLIKNTDIFIKNYHRPIKVIIIGAVHIAQHLINFTKNLDFELIVIDPRNFFSSNKKYFDVNFVFYVK